MSTILAKLFGSGDRVKLIRLFLLNSEKTFTSKEIIKKAKITGPSFRKELNLLSGIGLVRSKAIKKTKNWILDRSFPLLFPLKDLVLDTTPLSRSDFLKKMSKAGRLKLVVLAGIFIQKENSRADILVVGDRLKKNIIEKVLKVVEAEVGKELSYAAFETKDFIYRMNICDKFVRDVLDYPHQKILNKLNI